MTITEAIPMAIPKRMPMDTRGFTGNATDYYQHNAITMQPADTLLGFHMGNTPLVFQNGKYHSGFPQREMHQWFSIRQALSPP
jgi:hypothetical protein